MAHSKNSTGKRAAGKASVNGHAKPKLLAAYFLSLSLENVRCFGPKQRLDLSDGNGKPARWTIILGLNGTGKTTVLQSLVGFETLSGGEFSDRLQSRFAIQFRGNLRNILRGEGESPGDLSASVAQSGALSKTPSKVAIFRCSVEPGLMKVSSDDAISVWCCGYGAGRRIGTAILGDAGVDSTASLFSGAAELQNPEEWLLRLDYAANKPSPIKARSAHRLQQVKDLLLGILPEIEAIRLTTKESTNPTSRAEFKTPYGWVPLKQLGYGYQTLITWVADLASRMVERYPDSADPLAEPAVVLVDEIDLHLHPKWQRELIGFLTERFPNTQFIATAHSPLVAQAAADANLAVLRRDGDHVVIDNDVDNIRNWRVDQILTSDLFGLETARPPQIEKLLLERRALLTKAKLTAADQKRVKQIEDEMGDLPVDDTAEQIKERQVIRETIELLMKERKAAR
jgi:AAA domain, putative AbiEii toxin, Type IV TA system